VAISKRGSLDDSGRRSIQAVSAATVSPMAPNATGDAVAAGSAPVMNQRTASGGTTCVATRTPLCQRCRCSATSTMLPAHPSRRVVMLRRGSSIRPTLLSHSGTSG
jgi:hypothetical protein